MTVFRRPMDFSGSWYPARREACQREIEAYWRRPGAEEDPPARLGVVPHAGWVYSGALAARVFRALSGDAGVQLVIVLGGHLRRDDPIVAMTEGTWDTPFGPFEIHTGFTERLGELTPVRLETESRYLPDNSTELQLPFAKLKFPRAELLALRVPPGPLAVELGRTLAAYLTDSKLDAVAVASTDLTHYGSNYAFEPKGRGPQALEWVRTVNDPAFIRAVEAGDGASLLKRAESDRSACSAGSVAAINEIAQSRGQRFRVFDYATSADVAGGDTGNFVGYVGGVYA